MIWPRVTLLPSARQSTTNRARGTSTMSKLEEDPEVLLDAARLVVDALWGAVELAGASRRRRKKATNKEAAPNCAIAATLGRDTINYDSGVAAMRPPPVLLRVIAQNTVQTVINNSLRRFGQKTEPKSPRNHNHVPSPRYDTSAGSSTVKKTYSPSKKLKSPRKISASKLRKRSAKLRQVRPVSSAGMSNIDWPLTGNFDVEAGKTKIIEFIEKTWEYNPSLNYIVEHVYTAQLTNARRFKYRVCWYWPDMRRRSSMSTASVYFNIDVSYVETNRRVEVTYTFQRDKLLHRPGRSRFHQKWLSDLVEGRFLVAQLASA